MFCYKCGTQVQDDAAFCSKCGADLSRVGKNQQGGGTETLNKAKKFGNSLKDSFVASAKSFVSEATQISNSISDVVSSAYSANNPYQQNRSAPVNTQAPMPAQNTVINGTPLERGNALRNAGRHAEAFACYQEGANQGDPACMKWLGVAYEYGHGVQANIEAALQWYEKSAALGDEVSMNNIGMIYKNGKGVPVDLNRARYFLEHAVSVGNINSQWNLALLLSIDFPWILKDMERAFWLYEKCANTDCEEKGLMVSLRLYGRMADMYANGFGVTRDLECARKWMTLHQQHCKLNNYEENNLKIINAGVSNEVFGNNSYNSGMRLLDEGKPSVALEFFNTAANCGHRRAHYMAYRIYRIGIDGVTNPEKAAYWLNKLLYEGRDVPEGAALSMVWECIIGEIMPVDLDKANHYVSPLTDDAYIDIFKITARDARNRLAQSGYTFEQTTQQQVNSPAGNQTPSNDTEFESFV